MLLAAERFRKVNAEGKSVRGNNQRAVRRFLKLLEVQIVLIVMFLAGKCLPATGVGLSAAVAKGEVSTFKLWCDLYGKIMARDENRPLEEIELSEILHRYPIPREIDFRMSYVPIKSK